MVRAAIFNIIDSLALKRGVESLYVGGACLDLYAGSGALGFEALSRGVRSCTFVERERTHAKIIALNAKQLSCESQVAIQAGKTVEKFLSGTVPEGFSLIFADPPYAFRDWAELLTILVEKGWLREQGLLVCEHDPELSLEVVEGLECHSHRVLGPAGISIFTRRTKGAILGE